ncbi:cyclic nucleotide-binding domain-containing protein [Desulforhopalus singaporensis]|uniref:Cyclic nucleotide-binding domain-containing protein n=1 Tax=Desulforhopalus singaporensis TaxID=91360 RepID=A0A1H0N5B6_9BACT|nr:cyclic nucleotide-binding domain-containing protein [Desulforhopalus singaporensis]SDO87897.1 Cyclic nucleotide-binding domain-containing protein [Desulforhopalus singaporensis]
MSSSTEKKTQVPEMQQNLELLKELALFSVFPAQALKLLALYAEQACFPQNDILFEKGDDEGRAYLILSGELELTRDKDGETQVITHFHNGDFVGSFSLFGSMPSMFCLKAVTRTQVLTVSRMHFGKIMEKFPEISAIIIKYMIKEIHRWERHHLHENESCCLKKSGVTVL